MLSPDVPEFVPRQYQTSDSTNTVIFQPKESTSQPQQTKPPPSTYNSSSHARSNPPPAPKSSPMREAKGRTHGLLKQNDIWKQPRETFHSQRESQTREDNRHEHGTENIQQNESSVPKKELPEKQISQKSKGKPKTVSDNLELHIKNKFIVTSNPSSSYTKILKSNQPAKSLSEGKTSKQQDFSVSNEWPTLGESLPLHKMPERNSESPGAENSIKNPWVRRSNEGSPRKSPVKNAWRERGIAEQSAATGTSSPIKHPMKKTVNPWQENGTAERGGDTSVRTKATATNSPIKRPVKTPTNPWQERNPLRPKIIEGNPMTSEDSVKTELASHIHQRKEETGSPLSGNNRLDNKNTHLLKDESDKSNKEPSNQKSYARTAVTTEVKNTHAVQNQDEESQVAKNTTTQEESDLFQWKVIGEKKKKVKIKPQEEIKGSAQLQALFRGDGNKCSRVLPKKPSQNDSTKENQEYTSKTMKKYVLDLSKSKGVNSLPTQETQGAIKKDAVAAKTGEKERKKARPTKVMSLANCSNDKKETRPHPKMATTTAVGVKPVDEETLQRKLAFKLMKKEEKKKLKEMKACERKALMRPKDTKVSFITTNFLEKTQVSNKTTVQPSSQTSTSDERINFSFEEYPSLHMQKNQTLSSNKAAPQTSLSSLPLHTDTHHNSPASLPSDRGDPQTLSSLPTTINVPESSRLKLTKKSPSAKGRLPADDLLSGLGALSSDDDLDVLEECATTTYKTALLSAKEKETKADHRHIEITTDFPKDITPQKKKVRTNDPIQLDLFALAAKSGKNKKKESENYAEKFSPAKRRIFEDKREDEVLGRKTKTGVAAQPKGAVVVAKRGKVNARKPQKKKISRVKRCKMEKKQREMLALQYLLEQAKVAQQQELLEASPITYNETEESTKGESVVEGSDTNGPLNTVIKTKADKEEHEGRHDEVGDLEKQKPSQEKSEGKIVHCDENKENERSHKVSNASVNISSQVLKAAAEGNDTNPTLIWKIKGIQYPITEDEVPVPEESIISDMKDRKSDEEGKASNQHSTEDKPNPSHSPAPQKLLTDDPLIAQKASNMIDLIKLQCFPLYGPREYCHQVVTTEVNAVATELITSLIAFQKRHYQRDPTKARIRKRYVCGLKETTKLMGKMSCVIMAPNIEQCEGQGSLDDAVEKLLNQAEKLNVPVVFALSTKEMKKLCHRSSRRVSCFGIISYQGAQDIFQRLMQLLPEAQKQYQQLVARGQCTLPKQGEEEEEEEEEGERGPAKKDVNTEVLAHTRTLLMAP